jgi:hypothetical protein
MGLFNINGHDCNVADFDFDSYLSLEAADEEYALRSNRVNVEDGPIYDPFGDDFRFHDEDDELDLTDIGRVELYDLDCTGIIDSWSEEAEEAFGDFYDDVFHGMVGYQEDIRDWHYSDCRHIDLVKLKLEAKDEEVELELQTRSFKLPSFSTNRRPMIRMNAYDAEYKMRRKERNAKARYH